MKKVFSILIFSILMFIFTGCDSASEETTNYNYMRFEVDSVQKEYSSIEGYGFLTDSNQYWNVWEENWDADESDHILFEIPNTATTGSTFTQALDDTVFNFSLTINGISYSTDTTESFTLTITEWGGIGAIVKGTFSGTLLQNYPSGSGTVVITNGTFEATNNTDRTEK